MTKLPNKNPVTMTDEMFEAYCEYKRVLRYCTGKYQITNDFVLTMEKRTKELKAEYQGRGGRVFSKAKSNKENGLHLEIIEEINRKFSFNEMDDYGLENVSIPLKIFMRVIEDTSEYRDVAKLRQIKNKILDLMDLKQIQKGRDYFIVSKKYIST